mgnify:CR=1 FL=1
MSETDSEDMIGKQLADLAVFTLLSFLVISFVTMMYGLAYISGGIIGILVLTGMIVAAVASGWFITTQTDI